MTTLGALSSKFRGALIGALMGDCLGSPYEMCTATAFGQVNTYFAQLFDPKRKVPYKPYTDDTAMTRAVTESLIQHKGLNPQHLAQRFMTDYFAERKRGYGSGVHDVFMDFRRNGVEDPFYAARKQFGGQGSFGNGAAMRAAPVGLFWHDELDQLLFMTSSVSRITHAHAHGIQGAILQALAVSEALHLDPSKQLDHVTFLDRLLIHMERVEKEVRQEDACPPPPAEIESQPTFTSKLKKVKEFLGRNTVPSAEEVGEELGVGVSAIRSVPAAIYAFLLSSRPIPGLDLENHMVRCIGYSISLGGDTDTIASMGAAICGAYTGYDGVPTELLRHCEKSDLILKIADDLFTASQSQRVLEMKSTVS